MYIWKQNVLTILVNSSLINNLVNNNINTSHCYFNKMLFIYQYCY